jgi:hypothetical protein
MNCLVPYKRYDAESIEGVVSEPAREDIAVDDSTIGRWRSWFLTWTMLGKSPIINIEVISGKCRIKKRI